MQPIYKKYIATVAIIWAASFILMLLAYFFIIVPQEQQTTEAAATLSQKDFELKRAQNADSNESKARLAAELAGLNEKFNLYAANITDISKLAFDIGQAANDLSVLNFSCKGRIEDNSNQSLNTEHLTVLPVTMAFQGTFRQFAKFLNQLERHHPILFLDRFSIAHSSNSDIDNQANMSLSVYVSKFELSKAPAAQRAIIVKQDANAPAKEPNKPAEPNKPKNLKEVNEPNVNGLQTAKGGAVSR